jgi:anti-sigma factor ChrR (cupin superfamily)
MVASHRLGYRENCEGVRFVPSIVVYVGVAALACGPVSGSADPGAFLGRKEIMATELGPDDSTPFEPESEAWLAEALARTLPAGTAPPTGREQLLAAVQALPLRYAPFFERLAGLWSLPVEDVEGALSSASDPRKWRGALPGLRYFDVAEPTAAGRARMLRLAPGFRFPEHRHAGEESVLVLEGSYTDSSGDRVRAGDLRHLAAGSTHGLVVGADAPCVAAILNRSSISSDRCAAACSTDSVFGVVREVRVRA